MQAIYPGQVLWQNHYHQRQVQQSPGTRRWIWSLQSTCHPNKEWMKVWRMFSLDQWQRLLSLKDQLLEKGKRMHQNNDPSLLIVF